MAQISDPFFAEAAVVYPIPGLGAGCRTRVRVNDQVAYLTTDPRLPDNPIVDASPAFFPMTGYTRDEVIGRNCRFLQGPETCPESIDRIRQAVLTGADLTIVLLNYRKDGVPFWNELTVGPVRDATNRITHFLGIQREVSGPGYDDRS